MGSLSPERDSLSPERENVSVERESLPDDSEGLFRGGARLSLDRERLTDDSERLSLDRERLSDEGERLPSHVAVRAVGHGVRAMTDRPGSPMDDGVSVDELREAVSFQSRPVPMHDSESLPVETENLSFEGEGFPTPLQARR